MVRDRRVQAKNVPGVGNFRDQRLAFAGRSGELHLAGAKDKNPARLLAFYEQYRRLGVNRGGLDLIQFLQGCHRQIAEKVLLPHRAGQAVVEDVEAVGSAHIY